MIFFRSFRWLASMLTCIGVCVSGPAAIAQSAYPDKPIRMLVGFPPGGGVDIVARLLAVRMQKTLGQPVTVDNRTGAAGNIATDAAAKATPDGYTVLLGNTGSLSINPALYKKLSFDVGKDLQPVALVSTSPLVILVRPDQPARSLAELLARGRDASQAHTYGTGGAGSISHLTFELLKSRSGANFTHIPYRGGSPAITDLLGGQVDVVVEGVPIAAPFLASQRLRALAVTSQQRAPTLPGVPTAIESGFSGFTATAWYGLMVPAATPRAVIDRLNAAVNAALRDPAMQKQLAAQGSEVAGGTSQAFGDFLRDEQQRWAEAVRTSGTTLD